MTNRFSVLRSLAAVLLAAWGAPWPAAATSFVPIADGDLFDRSPVVVEGRVLTVGAAPVAGRPAIDYEIDVERVFKGGPAPGSRLTVRVPGGVRPDGLGLKIWGAPRLAEGEEALLFLEPGSDGTFALFQLMLGAFRVGFEDARKVVRRDLDEAQALSPAGGTAPADGVRDLAAFRRWLADRARGRQRDVDYFLPGRGPEEDAAAGSGADAKFALITSTTDPPPFGCGEDGGHAVRWFADRTGWPVTWRIQIEGQRGLEGGGLAEYQEALSTWGDDPNTPVRYLHFGGTRLTNGFVERDGVNSVIFGDPNDEIGGSFAETGILAIGGPWFVCETARYAGELFHPIIEADIVLEEGIEAFFDAVADPSRAAAELFTHELGHTLGLGHSPRRDALMRAQIHTDGRGGALHVDDLRGVFFLYGRPDLPIDNDGSPLPFLKVPEAPTGLTATLESFDQVRLAWTDRSTNESNFWMERRQRGELGFATAGAAAAGRETFLDTVTPDADYTYRVFAQNASGRSPSAELASLTVPEDLRPRPPSNLWSAAISLSSVRLTWQDESDDETGFVIELRDRNDWMRVPSVLPPDVVAVELEGLRPGTTYEFRMRSVNQIGESEPSNRSSSSTFMNHNSCASRGRALCLATGRLRFEVEYRAPGRWVPATVAPLTDRTGTFFFFNAANPEVAVRLFDDPGEDLKLAVSGLTSLGFRVVVRDDLTGKVARRTFGAGLCGSHSAEAFHFPRALPGLRKAASGRSPADSPSLDPAAVAVTVVPRATSTEPCRDDDSRLCLFDGRFAAGLERIDETGSPMPASALAGAGETGFFVFEDSGEPDVLFKMLDARRLNGRFWVFSSPPLPLASYLLSVTDTVTGTRRVYDYSAGSGCVLADTAAFAVE